MNAAEVDGLQVFRNVSSGPWHVLSGRRSLCGRPTDWIDGTLEPLSVLTKRSRICKTCRKVLTKRGDR